MWMKAPNGPAKHIKGDKLIAGCLAHGWVEVPPPTKLSKAQKTRRANCVNETAFSGR